MLNFIKALYYGQIPLKKMLLFYGIPPLLIIVLIENLRIFSDKIALSIIWLITIFAFISWNGIIKNTSNLLLRLIASIILFILFIVVIFAGPMAMIFTFSGYHG
ncbi:hypothetical protein [Sulfurovum mangrovi]|uniref:hypothetical protein n=1 Tax=Sulfurovum mangrovi TaxID=2893889 RepID=UPI001E424A9F|nr:hypothetical protein [Sulfurovum mangrovi]UFH59252.1 hypothetical protein LN246_13085 [Sulfurovum mangrovi]